MERKQITFDTFVRGVLGVIIVVGIVMLLNRLSGVLLPFFLAWLVAYLLFPLVKFFQYRCRLRYRIVAILLSFLVAGSVLAGVFMLMIPPMIAEGGRVADLIVHYVQTDETISSIPRLVQQFAHDHVDVDQLKKLVTQEGFIDTVKETIPKVWAVISQSISIVSSVFSLTMVALYTLFILLDYEEITSGWPRLLPRRYRPFAKRLVADVEEDAEMRMEGGQRTVGFIDFHDDVFRLVVCEEVAWKTGPFRIKGIAAIDHEDAFAQRFQRGGDPACDGCLATGSCDGDLRGIIAVQCLRKGGGAMDDGAIRQGYQIHIVLFDGGGDDERVRLFGLRAGAVLRIEADPLRAEAVVEMLFAEIIEAAVASRDGISLMDK